VADTLEPADAVLQGVFHQRLQDEIRHQRVLEAPGDPDVDLEPSLETDLHDLEIAPQEDDFLRQGHLGRVRPFERGTQELGQARDHAPHAFRVALHQRRDRVQRVEEKVRVHLRAQRRETRVGQLRLQVRGVGLQARRFLAARAITQEVVACEGRGEHRAIDDVLVHEPQAAHAQERRDIHRRRTAWNEQYFEAKESHDLVDHDGEHEPDAEKERDAGHPIGALDAVTAHEPEDEWRDERPERRLDERERDRRRGPHRLQPAAARIDQPVDGGQHGDECPEGQDHQHVVSPQ
jgi:hypothetical protein